VSVEEVNFVCGGSHVRMKLEIFQQCARSTFLYTDDDCPRKALGGMGSKAVQSDRSRRQPDGMTPVDG